MNTADYLLELAEDSHPAIVSDTAEYSYRVLREASRRIAAELAAAGIQGGDGVGLLARNSLFWIAAYLATMKLGAVAVPFATTATADDLVAQQALVDCRAICAETPLARRFHQLFANEIPWIPETALRQAGHRTWPEARALRRQMPRSCSLPARLPVRGSFA
jgi:acyl-CoA synthetase (AMP-forming)/AMP-acid ligase II